MMREPVIVLGMGAAGVESLSRKAQVALANAQWLAGGKRHLQLVCPPEHVKQFVITDNIIALVDQLKSRGPEERCVVLASGDPLCYGVGATLRRHFAANELVIEPAVSSLQLAFARAGISWTDAEIASIHGRPLASTLIPLLGRPKIGIFTQDGTSPRTVAQFFLERGLNDYTVWIGENLGADQEQVSHYRLSEIPSTRFADLNFLILIRDAQARTASSDQGNAIPPDHLFAVPETGPVLLTHRDVRAMALSRFYDLPEGPLWDIGAGLGGVSIGMARRFPDVEVIAAEQSPERFPYLEENRRRFEVWNLRLMHGRAPAAFAEEVSPAGVFLGGSGGELPAILDLVIEKLQPGGVFVADFIGLENLSVTLERLRQASWKPEVAQVQLNLGHNLAGLTAFSPLRPVWIVRATRPSSE